VPDYFTRALQKNKKALKVFEGLSPSHKKEYIEWITDAKAEETRNRRMDKALEYECGEGIELEIFEGSIVNGEW